MDQLRRQAQHALRRGLHRAARALRRGPDPLHDPLGTGRRRGRRDRAGVPRGAGRERPRRARRGVPQDHARDRRRRVAARRDRDRHRTSASTARSARSCSTRRSAARSTSPSAARYPETGGTNESAVHWDMICDLRRGGRLTADGEPIVVDGRVSPDSAEPSSGAAPLRAKWYKAGHVVFRTLRAALALAAASLLVAAFGSSAQAQGFTCESSALAATLGPEPEGRADHRQPRRIDLQGRPGGRQPPGLAAARHRQPAERHHGHRARDGRPRDPDRDRRRRAWLAGHRRVADPAPASPDRVSFPAREHVPGWHFDVRGIIQSLSPRTSTPTC